MCKYYAFILLLLSISGHVSYSEEIIQFSASAQGNGYNWASTLGWLSESLKQTALHAKSIEKSENKTIKINILSFSGGSSSSAVAVLIDSALSNRSINSKPGSKLLTPDETFKLAELISFTARGLDYDIFTQFFTTIRAISTIVKSNTLNLIKYLPGINQFSTLSNRSQNILSRKIALSDFSRLLFFVRVVNYNLLATPLSELEGYDIYLEKSKSNKLLKNLMIELKLIKDTLSGDLISFSELKELDSDIKSFLDWQKDHIRKVINNEIIQKSGYLQDKLRRFGNMMIPGYENIENEPAFKRNLYENISDGMMTIALAKDFDSKEDFNNYLTENKKVPYDNLKLFVFMNERTARDLIESKSYRHEVIAGNEIVKRYVIAVIDQRWVAMNNSIQEPGLFEDLYGTYDSQNTRIKYIYDPSKDLKFDFLLRSTRSYSMKDRIIYVVGGFAYRPILSLLQSFYNTHKLSTSKFLKAFHFTFEKDQQPEDKNQYSISLLNSKLKPNGLSSPLELVNDYLSWNKGSLEMQKKLFSENKSYVIESKVLWDLHKLPAQLVNLSHILFFVGKKAAINSYNSILKPNIAPPLSSKMHPEQRIEIPSAIVSSCLKNYQ